MVAVLAIFALSETALGQDQHQQKKNNTVEMANALKDLQAIKEEMKAFKKANEDDAIKHAELVLEIKQKEKDSLLNELLELLPPNERQARLD